MPAARSAGFSVRRAWRRGRPRPGRRRGRARTPLGRTRVTPGTPAPGQEAEAARHAGRSVEGLSYEAHEPMAIAILDQIADEISVRFGVDRVAIVHRSGDVPLGEASVAVVAVSPH